MDLIQTFIDTKKIDIYENKGNEKKGNFPYSVNMQ